MNTLLLFFALPIATIILAIVLEKLLRNPILTAATFFAIYLIVAFAAFDEEFLVFVIAYTILAFIAAVLAEIFFRKCREDNSQVCRWRCHSRPINNNTESNDNNTNSITLSNQDIARIANQLATIQNNNNNNNCNNCNNTRDVVTANITNNTTGGRSTWCCYRR